MKIVYATMKIKVKNFIVFLRGIYPHILCYDDIIRQLYVCVIQTSVYIIPIHK